MRRSAKVSKYCHAWGVPPDAIMQIERESFARQVAESLDFLCLTGRFPLFSGALE
jgi:hypothetical protein